MWVSLFDDYLTLPNTFLQFKCRFYKKIDFKTIYNKHLQTVTNDIHK